MTFVHGYSRNICDVRRRDSARLCSLSLHFALKNINSLSVSKYIFFFYVLDWYPGSDEVSEDEVSRRFDRTNLDGVNIPYRFLYGIVHYITWHLLLTSYNMVINMVTCCFTLSSQRSFGRPPFLRPSGYEVSTFLVASRHSCGVNAQPTAIICYS